MLLSHFSHVWLCNPIDSSPPGFPIPGILQARTLEWVAISFSNAWKWKVKVKSLSRVLFLATPWTAAYRLLCPWDLPGKGTGVGCHCLLLGHGLRKLFIWSNEFLFSQEKSRNTCVSMAKAFFNSFGNSSGFSHRDIQDCLLGHD